MEPVQKAFLQAMLRYSCLELSKAEQIYNEICDMSKYFRDTLELNIKFMFIDQIMHCPEFEDYVKTINKTIQEYGQTLSIIKHPLLGEKYVVFNLTYESNFAKVQPSYSEEDRVYFAKLLEAIAKEDNYEIHWLDVYRIADNIPNKSKKFNKMHVQDLFNAWLNQGYFIKHDDKLSYGPKMLTEFENHLKKHYSFIKNCPLCQKIVLWVSFQ